MALGQSVGATAAVFMELGWGLSGTQRIARQCPSNRARSYALSLVTKLVVGAPLMIAAATLAAVLVGSFRFDAALIAVATCLTSLSAGWIFIGIMRPRLFLLAEALPRAGVIALAAVMIDFGAPLLAYSVALLASAVAAPLASSFILRVRGRDFVITGARRSVRLIGYQLHALGANVFSSLYISFGVVVATLGSSHAALLYASSDRIMRMLQQVMSAQLSIFKGWVGRMVDPRQRERRALLAVILSALAGLVFGSGYVLIAPAAAEFVFSGKVKIPVSAALLSGASLAVICTSMATGGVLLVALGRIDAIASSAMVGAIVGVPLIYVGSATGQGVGALAGQLAAETVVLALQLAIAGATLRARRVRRAVVVRARADGV